MKCFCCESDLNAFYCLIISNTFAIISTYLLIGIIRGIQKNPAKFCPKVQKSAPPSSCCAPTSEHRSLWTEWKSSFMDPFLNVRKYSSLEYIMNAYRLK